MSGDAPQPMNVFDWQGTMAGKQLFGGRLAARKDRSQKCEQARRGSRKEGRKIARETRKAGIGIGWVQGRNARKTWLGASTGQERWNKKRLVAKNDGSKEGGKVRMAGTKEMKEITRARSQGFGFLLSGFGFRV